MAFQPEALHNIRSFRGCGIEALSDATGLEESRIANIEKMQTLPTKGEIERLASALAVPSYAFFDREYQPERFDAVDFRGRNPKAQITVSVLKWLRSYFELQRYLKRFAIEILEIRKEGQLFYASHDENPEQIAAAFANNINFKIEDVLDDFESPHMYYKFLRHKIEDAGIFVFHESIKESDIKGACISDPEDIAHIVVINTRKQNSASRIFTLLHEVAHVLLRETGISNAYVRKNEIERFCNRFAINFLVPRIKFQEFCVSSGIRRNEVSSQHVKRVARLFNVSQQAIAIRFEELGYAEDGFYHDWLEQFRGREFPDEISDFGRSDQPDQGVIKLAKYGTLFARVVVRALSERKTDLIEVFRYARLKPQYVQKLSDASDARIDELVAND